MRLLSNTCAIIMVFLATAGTMRLLGQSSPTTSVLSLDVAIARAESANPDVLIARAKQHEATSGVQEARSALFPKIGASETFIDSTDPVFAFGTRLRQGRFAANDLTLSRLNDPPPTSDFVTRAGATWTVFDSWHTIHQIRGARTSADAVKEHTIAIQQEVAFQVIRAYYRALLADQEADTIAAALVRAKSFAKQTHDRVEAGIALAADGMQADVDVSQREQESAEAESNAMIAYSDLAGLLGGTSDKLVLAAPEGEPEHITTSLDDLESTALHDRPDLITAKSEMDAAQQLIRASHDSYGPQVSTFANVEADNPHLTGGGNTNWTVGAKMKVEIFDGGERKAEISKASAQREIAEASFNQAKIQVGLEVKRAYYAQQTAERQYGISNDMLNNNKETLRTSLDRYNTGLVTATDVLRQQEQLRDMELSQVQSLYQWWIADAQLHLATGAMNIDSTKVHP